MPEPGAAIGRGSLALGALLAGNWGGGKVQGAAVPLVSPPWRSCRCSKADLLKDPLMGGWFPASIPQLHVELGW